MATYNVTAGQNSGNPRPGDFWLHATLDFQKNNAAENDVFRVLKLKQGWLVSNSFYKVKKAGTSGTDWEVGYNGATTDIVDITDPTATTEWTQGSEEPSSPYQVTADKYIEVKVTSGPETSGVLMLMFNIVAGIDEGLMPDMNIDD
jgi:hypothetical protein